MGDRRDKAARAGWWTGLAVLGGGVIFLLDRLGSFLERAGQASPPPLPSGKEPDPEALALHHEPDRVKVRLLAWLGAALVAGLAILLACLWGLQSLLGNPPDRPGFRPLALPQAGSPEYSQRFREHAPGLFPDLIGDLRRYREREAAAAPGYKWIDRKAGVVGIPVERAMERIAERGIRRWDFRGVTGGAAAPPDSGAERRKTAPAGKARERTP